MKKVFLLGAMVCALGAMVSCDFNNIDLGDGYALTCDYPHAIWFKRTPSSGPIVLPLQDSVHCDNVVVNVYWDNSTIYAVCCEDKYSADSTCWRVDKETKTVSEITLDEFNATVSSHKMKHNHLLSRYKHD